MAVPGVTHFQLIDEDGDELPGDWEFAWEGRDPFDVVIAAVTEVSGKPWKWSSKRIEAGRLSPMRCKALSIRVGKVLRSENRAQTSAVIARVVGDEYLTKPLRKVDPAVVATTLAGKGPGGINMQPEVVAAVMLRAFREALKAAVECEGGLIVSWQVET